MIDLEQAGEFASASRRLVTAHHDGQAEVAIPAVMASERQRGDRYLEHFDRFLERLKTAGLDGLPIIEPIAVFGISFYDRGLLADQPMVDLENAIHAILYPDVEPNLSDYCAANDLVLDEGQLPPKWRNVLCDVQIVWSHIYHKRDCLVTRDRNFLKKSKASALVDLGVGRILRPEDAIGLLEDAA